MATSRILLGCVFGAIALTGIADAAPHTTHALASPGWHGAVAASIVVIAGTDDQNPPS